MGVALQQQPRARGHSNMHERAYVNAYCRVRRHSDLDTPAYASAYLHAGACSMKDEGDGYAYDADSASVIRHGAWANA